MISINFISSKDNDEERVMHSKSDNKEMMINDKKDEVIEEIFRSLLSRYQIGLETLRTVVISYLILFIYCSRNDKKYILSAIDSM